MSNIPYFLEGDGEMAQRTRRFDWAATPVGAPEHWPESLRNTVAMILQSRFPMFLWWGEELIQFYNDAYRPSLGNNGKHPKALGQRAEDCWPEIWPVIQPLINQVLTTGKATWSEDLLLPIYRNGALEDVYWTFGYSPIRVSSGEIKGVLVVCTETTEKVEALARIKTSENNVRTLIEQSPVAMGLFKGPDIVVEYINESFLKLWGKDASVIGKPIVEALPEMKGQAYPQIMLDVYNGGELYQGNEAEVYLSRDGALRQGFYDFINAPYRGVDGKIEGVIVVANEVTEAVKSRKKIEQILAEVADSEANFRNLILKAPVAMCLLRGPEHVIEIANDMMVALWGKPSVDVMNKPVFEALPDARGQGLEAMMTEVYQTGKSIEATEMPVQLLRNGLTETVYQNFVYQAYRDNLGRIAGIIAITIDVTPQVLARQRIEEIVADRTAELKRSNDELAKFAYIASHDLQEPVRKVLTYAELLGKQLSGSDERVSGFINKIMGSAIRMQTLIRDVLTYSELAKADRQFTTTDLSKVIDEITGDFELSIRQKQATIKIGYLPSIDCIPLQMSQLFGNLISNALKFTKPGIAPLIEIKAEPLSFTQVDEQGLFPKVNWFCITVHDNGVGFNQAHADKLFQIFQRLHTRTEYDGTGIGLALCRRIVENHHGKINAESTPENGSTFYLYLPQHPFTPSQQPLGYGF